MDSAPSTASRAQREQDYHDARYHEETRTSQARFYEGIDDSRAAYDRRLIEFGPADRVLEIGCGPTSSGWDLAARGVDVLGIDISPVAVDNAHEDAERRGMANISFAAMNAEALDLPDHAMDGVIGSGILHHLDLDAAYPEIARVLRPGGRATFLEPLGHNPLINGYRRITPSARTPDEHPLLRRDFDLAKRSFRSVEVSTHHVLSMAAAPVADRRWGEAVHAGLAAADRLLVRVPGIRWWAWIAIVALGEPRR